jgi:hypothetical protein
MLDDLASLFCSANLRFIWKREGNFYKGFEGFYAYLYKFYRDIDFSLKDQKKEVYLVG